MTLYEIIILSVALAMDAFAVSICKGLQMRKINYRHTFVIALFFGGFQALMPFLGWLLGKSFASFITGIDHWIAFGLLVLLGLKMVIETAREKDGSEGSHCVMGLDIKELTLLAIATSIDALAAGISLAFLDVSLVLSLTAIGSITFVICFAGVMVGNRFGSKFKKKAAYAGGIMLILIGVKILLDSLGVVNF